MDQQSGFSYVEFLGSTAPPQGSQKTKWGMVTPDGALCVTQEKSPASGDYVHQSIRYRNDDVMYVQVCGDPKSSDQITRLGRLTATGALRLDGLTFVLPLNDSGSGAVNTTPLFATGGATFTRATAATTILSNRTIGNVASGTARSYYFPDGTYGGYLAEGQRTNLCLAAENFSFAWAVVGTPTRVAAYTACGTVSLDLIGDDSAAALEGYSQTVTFTGDAVKSISLFVNQGTSTSSAVRLRDTVALADRLLGTIIWSAGAPIVSMTTGTFEGTDALAGGIYRLRFETTAVTAANANSLQVYPATDAALSVANVGTIGMGGVQAEDGLFCSTYIPTVSATVTRNADVLTYAFAGNAIDTVGSAYAEVSSEWTTAPATGVAIGFGADNTGPLRNNSAASTQIQIGDGTSNIAKAGLADMSTGVRKRASSWGSGLSVTGDGAAVAVGAFDGSMGSAAVAIGCNSAGINNWFGTIRNVRLWISRLPDGMLASITA